MGTSLPLSSHSEEPLSATPLPSRRGRVAVRCRSGRSHCLDLAGAREHSIRSTEEREERRVYSRRPDKDRPGSRGRVKQAPSRGELSGVASSPAVGGKRDGESLARECKSGRGDSPIIPSRWPLPVPRPTAPETATSVDMGCHYSGQTPRLCGPSTAS